jgi:hypothetical protein
MSFVKSQWQTHGNRSKRVIPFQSPSGGDRIYTGSRELGRSGSVIVPEVSRFLGIVIAMYYREHAPPHFHAKYGRQRAQFSIADLRIIEGKLPPRVVSLVPRFANRETIDCRARPALLAMTYNGQLCHCEKRSDEAISYRIVSELAKCGTSAGMGLPAQRGVAGELEPRRAQGRPSQNKTSGLGIAMHFVKSASYAGNYRLRIRFDDGRTKLVDLGPYLDGPIFEPLKDVSYFQRFEVNKDIDTVVWPNDADFSPDFLYSIGVDVGKEKARTIKAARQRSKAKS